MSWFLDGRDGLSQVSSDGFEEEFWPTGSRLDVAAMKAAAGSLVIDRTKGRPMKRSEPTKITKRSPACDALVRKWEGYHRELPDGGCEAYPDPGSDDGRPFTIGFGTTRYRAGDIYGRKEVRLGDRITADQAFAELAAELDYCEREVATRVTASLTQGMFDALVSFTYNLGWGGAKKQYDRVNTGKYEECAESFDLYVNGGNGKPLQGLINRRNEEEALFRKEPFPGGPVKPESSVARLTHNGALYQGGSWGGLLDMTLVIGDEEWSVASGARGAQNFRRPSDPRSVPGNLEPLPQGRYSLGDIQFAGGKDNYEGTHGAGLGPVWIPLSAEFSDDRGSFGIHLDANSGSSPGSAGCVVLRDVADLKRLVAALRKFDPKTLIVDWNLS